MRIRVYVAILLTALGLYLVGRWQGAASVADAAAVQNAQTALALGPTYRARLDSLRRIEQHAQHLAVLSRMLADSLRARAVRVDTLVTSDSAPVRLWRATANAEHETARACSASLAICEQRAQTAESRAAALDSLLGNVLKVKSCHILVVSCPSRTATGLFGLGIGLIGGILMSR